MKIIYSNILPFRGFRAINLFGIIFARKDFPKLTRQIVNHESIHSRQMLELFVLLFYVWYITEWIIRLFQYKNIQRAYENISFEREAYQNDNNYDYLYHRKRYSFCKYLTQK